MERTTVRVHTRSIDRKVALNKMHRKGMSRVCKEIYKPRSPRETKKLDKHNPFGFNHRSYFSNRWREYSK